MNGLGIQFLCTRFDLLAKGIRAIDRAADFTASRDALAQSAESGGLEDVFEASMRHTNSVGSAAYYTLNTLRIAAQITKIGLACVGEKSSCAFTRFFDKPVVGATLQGLGLVTSALTLVQESIAFFRQIRLLAIFKKATTQEQLEELRSLKDRGKLEKTLPGWLFGKLEKKTDDNIDSLSEHRNEAGIPVKVLQMLKEVKNMTQKKTLVHTLGWVSCLLCVLGFAALFPPVTAGLLVSFGFALWVVRWTLNQGLIENPHGGFSLMHLLPFLQSTDGAAASRD